MTREELLEKRRVGFEEYIRYRYVLLNNKTWTDEEIWDRFGAEWLLWNAALDSVEIELPSVSMSECKDIIEHCAIKSGIAIAAVCIEQQGYKVKP